MVSEEKRACPERWLTAEQVCTLFFICGFRPKRAHELKNEYWPDYPDYDHERWPWWLVETEFGLIKFGWRKRVISLRWDSIGLAFDRHLYTKSTRDFPRN
jgi:hypothetical protein